MTTQALVDRHRQLITRLTRLSQQRALQGGPALSNTVSSWAPQYVRVYICATEESVVKHAVGKGHRRLQPALI